MKAKRLLAGLMSLAMLCSVASTPIYALEDSGLTGTVQTTPSAQSTPDENAEPVQSPAPAEPTPVPTADTGDETAATPVPAGEEQPSAPLPETEEQPGAAPAGETAPTPEPSAEVTVQGEEAGSAVPAANSLNARSTTLAQAAENHYGENSADRINVGTVSARWGSAMTSDTAKAGQSLTVILEWNLTAAATYSYTTHPEPMFDNYKDSVIRIQLPDHVTIQNPDDTAASLAGVQSIRQTDAENNIWEIRLDSELPSKSASRGSVALPIFLQGNGELAMGTLLPFQEGDIQFETHFTILDRSTATPQETEYSYTQTAVCDWPGDITLTSDDEWILDKQPQGSPEVDADAGTVTVHFTLEYGLHNLENEGNEINHNPGSYGREGRVPFDGEVQLTEIPTVLDHGEIQPRSITVTPDFGNQTPIEVTPGTPVTLPVDVCGNHEDAMTGTVSADAPYRSTYQVTLVYDYDDFVTSYRDPNNGPKTIHNEATVAYTLAGDTPRTTTDSAEEQVQVVTEPAVLKVSKSMVLASGSNRLYSQENYAGDVVEGPATFTVTGADGQPATLYTQDSDGTYVELESNVLTIDPAAGSNGTVTVYLDPGTYTVTETDQPANSQGVPGSENSQHNADPKTLTLQAGKTGSADFYNKELLGSIRVDKKNENNNPLAGATFALYDQNPEDHPDAVALQSKPSDANGQVLFDRLPFGTYYVQETVAPKDYELSPMVQTITITQANPNHANTTVRNYKNSVTVTLQKYMSDGRDYQPVGSANYQEFEGAFRLQKRNAAGQWEELNENEDGTPYTYDLNKNGRISLSLEAHDEEGNAIQYKFIETMPAGWHDPQNPAAEEKEILFTMVDNQNNPTNKTLDVYNDRNGSFTLTKEFYRASTSGYTKEAAGNYEATFALYYTVEGDTQATLYADDLTTADGKLTVNNLPRTVTQDGTVKAYTYYLVETGAAAQEDNPAVDWLLDGTTQTIQTDDGEKKACEVFDFVPHGEDPAQLDQRFTVKNYENKVGVLVKKEDSITGAFVAGCTFTVKPEGGTAGEAMTIQENGTFVALEPGKSYTITEASWPAGYTPVENAKSITVDLRQVEPGAGTRTVTVTLKNCPDPSLQITKTLQPGGTTLTDQTFEVWQEVGGTLTDTGKTLTAGTALSLPVGTYYLKEVVPQDNPHNILDPNGGYASLYGSQGKTVNGTFYFGPFALEQVENRDDLVQNGAVTNYANLGSVTVQKNKKDTDGGTGALQGAVLGIFNAAGEAITDSEGNPITVTTGTDGKATFQNLPVYDANHNKIRYTIREVTAPEGYTLLEDTLQVVLTAGQTVTKDVNQKDLVLVNLPTVDFQVQKVYRHLWEYNFTGKDYLLPGTKIALYEEQPDGTYRFVDLQTTGELGTVTFAGLSQTKTYYAVEFSIPDEETYAFLEPYDPDQPTQSKDYLSVLVPDAEKMTDAQLKEALAGITLTNGQDDPTSNLNIHNYNCAVKQAVTSDDITALAQGTLVNAEHWTQLYIHKFKMADADGDGQDEKVSVDNATFELYQQILTGDPQGDEVLTFDNDQKDTLYTYIGRYSSGTLYNPETGERLPGWFGTDILKGGNHVVYWLVEVDAGTGATIMPENQVLLVRPFGSEYSNDSTSLDGTTSCTGTIDYHKDAITRHEVENEDVQGPGTAQYALVRIAKWAGSYDEDGNPQETYAPLGNATFDLYLVDKDGNPVDKLDTLTTGLDNENFDHKTAWASSSAISFAELARKVYGEAWEEPFEADNDKQNILWQDAQGNRYARVALVESDAPAGYSTPNRIYQMLLFFRATSDTEQSTTTYNDAFYLKEQTGSQDLAETMGPDDWAFYPTREEENGYTSITVPGRTSEQFRLVNWPVDNFAVTVTKYGYTVDTDPLTGNLNMTAAQLDDYYQDPAHPERYATLDALSGVTMQLQRLVDGKWQNYSYPGQDNGLPAGQFTTVADGSFAFPQGLRVGNYRIYEVTGKSGYENIYPDQNHAYYFQVTNENLAIHLYNPRYFSVTVEKTKMDGTTPLPGAKFTLNGVGAETGSSGTAAFTLTGSRVYTLSETAPTGYTARYLQSYLTKTYSGDDYSYTHGEDDYSLSQIAAGGIYLGFETEVVVQEGSPVDVKVTRQVDLTAYGLTGNNLKLTIPNPSQGSLTLEKQDTNGQKITVENTKDAAVFYVGRKDFTAWSGDQTITDDGKWDTKEYTLGLDGTLTLDKLEPGVYKIWEKKAPTGYLTDSTPQYVILTGGMQVNVTLQDGEGKTLTASTDPKAAVVFKDQRLLDLTVEKTIEDGVVTFSGSQTFAFVLKKADGTEVDRKTVTVTGGNTGKVTFADALVPGQEYTLTEEKAADFAWTSNNGQAVTGNTVTFTANTNDADMTFQATNTYLKGRIRIQKVDGTNGEAKPGAQFTVYKADGTTKVAEMKDNGDGSYTLEVSLDENKAQDFIVKETRAPAGYVTTSQELTVTVEPGKEAGVGTNSYQQVVDNLAEGQDKDTALVAAGIFPNYKGAVINLVKYNNIRTATSPAPVPDVTFRLYRQESGVWVEAGTAVTDTAGALTFTVDPGSIYALVESLPSGYYALEGIWQTAPTEIQLQADPANKDYYILNGGKPLQINTTYTLNAYNIPYVPVELRKQDALHPELEEQPTATMEVYMLPDGTTSLTEEEIANYMAGASLHTQEVSAQSGEGSNRYTAATVNNVFVVGKTYLVVERTSSYSQIRDHNSVEWYKIYTVPADATETRSVTLKNVEGNASLELEKESTATAAHESLLAAGTELEYVLTPSVENHYALDSFLLTDSGLTAYGKNADGKEKVLEFDKYLKDQYTITEVALEPSSQDGAAFNGGTQPNDLVATVTFYDFDGGKYVAEPVSAAASKTVYPDTDKKIKSVTVEYSSATMQAKGYALGQDFTPGTVTVRMTMDRQTGGSDVEAITKVTNHAKVELEYRTWDDQGGQSETPVPLDDTAEASDTFLPLDAARVSVTKTADTEQTSLDQTVTYTITLENRADATAAMQDPFLVDMLPQGTLLAGDAGNVKITEAPEGMTLRTKNTAALDGENVLFLYLDGDLQPGDRVVLTLQVQITNQVTRYGTDINNFVLAGSQVKGVQSIDNPQSSSFMTSDNAWPNDMDGVLTSMKKERVEILRQILDDKSTFGYVSSKETITWSAATGASVVKTGRGNLSQEQGFSDSLLSTVSNNGYMDYQLQFSNRSSDPVNFTNASLVDVFPFVGDAFYNHLDRFSEWGMKLDINTPVTLSILNEADGGKTTLDPGDDYRVFYYTGTVNENNLQAIYDQGVDLKFTTQTLPASWSETSSEDATAMVIAIKQEESIALQPQYAYLATYRLAVGPLEQDELAQNAWKNAVNNFVVHYSTYASGTDIGQAHPVSLAMDSNSVSNTIMPAQVKVGGHIWIDKDRDGVWDQDESVTDPSLSKLALVQELLESATIALNTFQGTGSTPATDGFRKDTDEWENSANFIFEGLDPASKQDGASEAQLYSGTEDNNPLNPAYLKGQSPKTYNITVSLPKDFQATVTSLGGGDSQKATGYSRHPDDLENTYKDEKADNNYLDNKGTAVSERFYLYPTEESVFDNTKDIGYMLERTLILHKVSAGSNPSDLEGAQFDVYGPFDSVEDANAAELNASNKVGNTLVTDASGKATVEHLNWFKVYVIVEKDSAEGYQLDGATAVANVKNLLTDYTGESFKGHPAWVLGIPGEAVTEQNQQVTVTNRTEVEYALTASKTLEGMTLQDNQFTFELLDENQKVLHTAKNVEGVATFPAIQKAETGTFIYYIREQIPEAAQDLVYGDIRYDGTLYRVTVKVSRNPDNKRLEASILYEVQQEDGSWAAANGASFTNRYLPAFEVGYTPTVNKTFAKGSSTIPRPTIFTFLLTPQADYGTAVQIGQGVETSKVQVGHGGGTVRFDTITFTQPGTYQFTITEQNDKGEGFQYDGTVWTLTVKVDRVGNDLTVIEATYTAPGRTPANWASFVNSYTPPTNPTPPPANPPEDPDQPSETPDHPVVQWLHSLLPQTGDSSNPALWLVLFCISAVCLAGIAGAVIYRRRNSKK